MVDVSWLMTPASRLMAQDLWLMAHGREKQEIGTTPPKAGPLRAVSLVEKREDGREK